MSPIYNEDSVMHDHHMASMHDYREVTIMCEGHVVFTKRSKQRRTLEALSQ